MNPYASGRLTLHAADLDQPRAASTRSPGAPTPSLLNVSHVSTYDDPEYVRRTCDHIVKSIDSSGIGPPGRGDLEPGRRSSRRPTSPSSSGGRYVDEDREPDESNPKRTPERGQGYSMGKVIAQHALPVAAAGEGGHVGRDHGLPE